MITTGFTEHCERLSSILQTGTPSKSYVALVFRLHIIPGVPGFRLVPSDESIVLFIILPDNKFKC
jgi:hypothetical protein